MNTDKNVTIDKIANGLYINNNETNFESNIYINLEKDIGFQYAIVNENEQDNPISFTYAIKSANINYKNTDGIYNRKLLLLKTDEGKTLARIKIHTSVSYLPESMATSRVDLNKSVSINRYQNQNKSFLNATGDNNNPKDEVEEDWYKKPINIGIMILIVLIVAILFFKNKNNNTETGGAIFNGDSERASLFLD